MPKNIGPGPGAYMLPPTVGYPNHDISKYRNPMYTMRPLCAGGRKSTGPGPQYDIGAVTRYGKLTPLSYTLSPKLRGAIPFNVPGPGTYSPEKAPRMKEIRPPAYSMAARFPASRKFNTPGPNQYTVPTTLGPKVPDKYAASAYTMGAKLNLRGKSDSPGPAQYGGIRPDIYKSRAPLYTMGPRCGAAGKHVSPGPAAYLPHFKNPIPGGISFGRRTDQTPYITADDQLPCAD